ncbi:protein phosphatase 1 regulatory subunit 3C-B-like, partial [Clarias magur]
VTFQGQTLFFITGTSAARVIPVGPAMHVCLNRHPSVDPFWETSTLRSYRTPTRPSTFESLRPRAARSSQISTSPISPQIPTSPCGTLKKKKQVVFADDKGLALTSVRFFDPDPLETDEDEEPSSPVKIKTSESSVQIKTPRLRLGFPQPSTDLSSFLEGLKKSLVRLERCSLIYGSLFGKVRVRNVSAEKAVHIRMTHNSWRSHQDIPCTPILQKGNAETEQFIFNIPMPSCPSVQDRLEFYVTFRPGSGNLLLLDNNDGKNYRILVEDVDAEEVSVEATPLSPQNSQSIP